MRTRLPVTIAAVLVAGGLLGCGSVDEQVVSARGRLVGGGAFTAEVVEMKGDSDRPTETYRWEVEYKNRENWTATVVDADGPSNVVGMRTERRPGELATVLPDLVHPSDLFTDEELVSISEKLGTEKSLAALQELVRKGIVVPSDDRKVIATDLRPDQDASPLPVFDGYGDSTANIVQHGESRMEDGELVLSWNGDSIFFDQQGRPQHAVSRLADGSLFATFKVTRFTRTG